MIHVINCDIDSFLQNTKEKKIYAYGASVLLKRFCDIYSVYNIENRIAGIIDNDMRKWNCQYKVRESVFRISSINELKEQKKEQNICILISIRSYKEIIKQLDDIKEFEGTDCYILSFIQYFYQDRMIDTKLMESNRESTPCINKVIHYCWFGYGRMNDLMKHCMESWYKYCPDYKIMKWDESNYNIQKNSYMKQAYESGNWAFVSDYARLDILYHYGGFYFDTDVEFLKCIDPLRYFKAFMAFDCSTQVSSGLGMGAVRGNKVVKCLLDEYENRQFRTEKGYDLTPCPKIQMKTLKTMGLAEKNVFQKIEDMLIFPDVYFDPFNRFTGKILKRKDSFTVHHYGGSWSEKNR